MTIHDINPQAINTAAEVVYIYQLAGITDPKHILDNITTKAYVTGSWRPPQGIQVEKWVQPEATWDGYKM